MSSDDRDPPAYRVSRPEDRARVLAEAMAHAEAQEAQFKAVPATPGRGPRWKGPTAMVLFGVAAALAVFPPGWLGPPRPREPTDAERVRGLRTELYLQAQQIEAFRMREGRLPDSLDEVPARFGDVRFVRSNSRVYQLVGHGPDGSRLIYDSARPDPVFRGVAAQLSRAVAP